MSIDKSSAVGGWKFVNEKLRKNLPTDIAPEVADADDDLRGFMLTLAMILNDLKGLVLINDTMNSVYAAPDPKEITGHLGEREGIKLQMLKLLLATLHEVLVFLEDSDEALDSKRFSQYLQNTSNKTQLVWELLRQIVRGEDVQDTRFAAFSKLQVFLLNARNNVGFHYQTRRRLLDGFRTFFFKKVSTVPPDASEWVYRSAIKSSVLTSRYYYADAALQGYYVNLFGDEKLGKERVDEAFDLLNILGFAINDLLYAFHETLPSR